MTYNHELRGVYPEIFNGRDGPQEIWFVECACGLTQWDFSSAGVIDAQRQHELESLVQHLEF